MKRNMTRTESLLFAIYTTIAVVVYIVGAWWHATGLWMDPGWDPHFAEIITSARVTVLHRVNETETETL